MSERSGKQRAEKVDAPAAWYQLLEKNSNCKSEAVQLKIQDRWDLQKKVGWGTSCWLFWK